MNIASLLFAARDDVIRRARTQRSNRPPHTSLPPTTTRVIRDTDRWQDVHPQAPRRQHGFKDGRSYRRTGALHHAHTRRRSPHRPGVPPPETTSSAPHEAAEGPRRATNCRAFTSRAWYREVNPVRLRRRHSRESRHRGAGRPSRSEYRVPGARIAPDRYPVLGSTGQEGQQGSVQL